MIGPEVNKKVNFYQPKIIKGRSVILGSDESEMSYETFDPMVILVYKSYTRDIIFSSLGALVGEKKNRKKKIFFLNQSPRGPGRPWLFQPTSH